MNAHADMFIVVGYNEINTPRSIYCYLVSGERKFPVFCLPKQVLINAFYNMSAKSIAQLCAAKVQIYFEYTNFFRIFM